MIWTWRNRILLFAVSLCACISTELQAQTDSYAGGRKIHSSAPQPPQEAPQVRQSLNSQRFGESSPNYFGIVGGVAKPAVYTSSVKSLTINELVKLAGGLTKEANGSTVILRRSGPVQMPYVNRDGSEAMLAPGDVLLVKMRKLAFDEETMPEKSPIACIGLGDRPVVFPLTDEILSLSQFLRILGQDHLAEAYERGTTSPLIKLYNPIGLPSDQQSLLAGCVIIFGHNSLREEGLKRAQFESPFPPPVPEQPHAQTNAAFPLGANHSPRSSEYADSLFPDQSNTAANEMSAPRSFPQDDNLDLNETSGSGPTPFTRNSEAKAEFGLPINQGTSEAQTTSNSRSGDPFTRNSVAHSSKNSSSKNGSSTNTGKSSSLSDAGDEDAKGSADSDLEELDDEELKTTSAINYKVLAASGLLVLTFILAVLFSGSSLSKLKKHDFERGSSNYSEASPPPELARDFVQRKQAEAPQLSLVTTEHESFDSENPLAAESQKKTLTHTEVNPHRLPLRAPVSRKVEEQTAKEVKAVPPKADPSPSRSKVAPRAAKANPTQVTTPLPTPTAKSVPLSTADRIGQLIDNSLPLVDQPLVLPSDVKLFGRAIGGKRLILDGAHPLAGPHLELAASRREEAVLNAAKSERKSTRTPQAQAASPRATSPRAASQLPDSANSAPASGLLDRVLFNMKQEVRG